MPSPRKQEDSAADRQFLAAFETRLGTVMGVRLTLLERLVRSRDAVPLASAWLVLYGAAFAFAAWWSSRGAVPDDGHARLFSLNLWNGLHFAVLILITRPATLRLLDVIRRDILPFASDDYAATVRAKLAAQPAFLLFQLVPYSVAALTAAMALWNIREEIEPLSWDATPFPLDLLMWIGGSFYIYFASMRAVMTATFTRVFAVSLDRERASLYPLGAADSPIVEGLAKLNRTMLAYWAMAFPVLLSAMLLLLPPGRFALSPGSPYLFVLIPVAVFFSLGVGTLVYLGNESAIRAVLRRYAVERAEPLQRQIDVLLQGPDVASEATDARVERLVRLHDRILAGSRYGSRVGTIVSIALPLVFPAIGLIERLFG